MLSKIFTPVLNFLVIYILVSNTLFAQTPPKNIEIIDSLLSLSADEILVSLSSRNIMNPSLFIAPDEADWLLKQKLLEKTLDFDIKFHEKRDSTTGKLEIRINIINVSYENLEDDYDLLKRKIQVFVTAIATSPAGLIEKSPVKTHSKNDTINRIQINYLQSKELSFTKGNVPEPPSSFFDEIAEPVILISSAIAAIILLFTLRSN